MLQELAAARPSEVSMRSIRNDSPEAVQYGAVLAPMVLINGKVVCAGMAPVKAGLEKLVEMELVASV
jgi:hypothetical protein